MAAEPGSPRLPSRQIVFGPCLRRFEGSRGRRSVEARAGKKIQGQGHLPSVAPVVTRDQQLSRQKGPTKNKGRRIPFAAFAGERHGQRKGRDRRRISPVVRGVLIRRRRADSVQDSLKRVTSDQPSRQATAWQAGGE